MRPIDADALREQVESHVTSMSVCLSTDESHGRKSMQTDCLEDIDNAPTIDVIPIDWMKKKIEEHRDNPFQDVYDAFRTVLTIWEHETEGKR